MKEVLPVIIVCCVGLAICFGILIWYFVRHIKKRFKGKREEFELDDGTLVVKLGKKDFNK